MTVTRRIGPPGPGLGPDPARPVSAARRSPPRPSGAASLVGLKFLVLTLIVFQRVVVPGAAISVALPVTLALILLLLVRGDAVADIGHTLLYLSAAGACVVADVLASAAGGYGRSLSSIALLILVYLPYCFRASPELRPRFPEVLRFFQQVMVVAAVACVLQWVAQLVGWQFRDLMDFVPDRLLVADEDFNYSYPIYYGSSIYKSNGVVFLEASFASQFLALAIIVQILLGGGRGRLVLFAVALVTTLSGTGLLLLAVGLVVLAVRRGGRWAGRALTAVAVAVLALGLTPAADLLADRAGEARIEGSSGNTRFVAPFVNIASAVARDPSALWFGRGAGSVTRDAEFFNPVGVLVNYTAAPKLVGEYGLPAGLVFIAFLLVVFLRRVPSITLGFMSCTLLFLLSGALLQPPIVSLCWLLTAAFAAAATAVGGPSGRRTAPAPRSEDIEVRPSPIIPRQRSSPEDAGDGNAVRDEPHVGDGR